MKYIFAQLSNKLIISLDTTSSLYNQNITYFSNPSVAIENNKIVMYENGKPSLAIYLHHMGTVNGVLPTDINDAFNKITAFITLIFVATTGGGGATPEQLALKTDKGGYTGSAKDLENAIIAAVTGASGISIVPTSPAPSGTGIASFTATQAGTYTNYGGVVVTANSFAIISRSAAGAFSISQTTLNLSTYATILDLNNNVANDLIFQTSLFEPINTAFNDIAVNGTFSNFPVNDFMFIPTNNITQDGFVFKFSHYLNNAQVGRTIKFALLTKTGTNDFVIDYVTTSIPAETASYFEYVLPTYIICKLGQYIGAIVSTPNTANSLQFISTPGPSYSYYGGWNKSASPIAVGSTFTGSVESQQRGFKVQAYTTATGTTPKFLSKDIVSDLSKSIENKSQNELNRSLGLLGNFPVNNTLFIPKNSIDRSGSLTQFSVRVKNIQVGRTVRFQVLQNTGGNGFKIINQTNAIPAEADGLFVYPLTTVIDVLSGYYIGAIVTTPNTANSIEYIDTGGTAYSFFGGWDKSAASTTIGAIFTGSVQPQQRGFDIQAIVSEGLIVKAIHRNKPFGFLGLDADAKVTKDTVFANDFYAGKKIIWVGTSIPAGGTPTSYPMLVGQNLNATVVNEAVGSSGMLWNGTRSLTLSATKAQLNAAFGVSSEAQSYENKIIGKQADLLVIDHIYNDTTYISASTGTIDSTDKSTIYGAFNFVIQAALVDRPLLKLIFVTPPNRYFGDNGNRSIATIDLARDIIFALAKKYNAPVCDLALLSNIHTLNYTNYKSDGVHPLNADLPRLASILSEFIKRSA
jgi:hypothetical protein